MIRSRDNARLKNLRRLRRERRWRASREQGLLEGPHLLEAALGAGLVPAGVFATAEFVERQPELVGRLSSPPTLIEPSLLDELADSDSPRGLVAAVPLPQLEVAEGLARAGSKPILAVEGLQDPGNLGALARVAEAAGAGLLVSTPGTVDWRHPRALRASTGSLLRLPVVGCTLGALRLALGEQRHPAPPWLGLSPRGGVGLWDPESLPSGQAVLVVGSEAGGLSADARSITDRTVTIPMEPGVESINVTAAAAVVLFELARRRHSLG